MLFNFTGQTIHYSPNACKIVSLIKICLYQRFVLAHTVLVRKHNSAVEEYDRKYNMLSTWLNNLQFTAVSLKFPSLRQSSAPAQLLARWKPQHMRRSSLSAHDGCQFCASCHAYDTTSMVKFVRKVLVLNEAGYRLRGPWSLKIRTFNRRFLVCWQINKLKSWFNFYACKGNNNF